MGEIVRQYAKIIDPKTHELMVGVGCPISYYIEIGMEWMETELAYNGKWYEKGYTPQEPIPPAPTYDEVKEKRSKLYRLKVDPITSHIQRLRDQTQTPEIETEIKKLQNERDYMVIKIQEENPYPEEVK